MIKKLLITIALLGVAVNAYSAPSISSPSGDIVHGETVVISGSGFTTHPDFGGSEPYLNIKWKNFEDQSMTSGGWTISDNQTQEWSVVSGGPTNSSYYAKREFVSAILASLRYTMGTNQTETYYSSFYFMMPANTQSGKLYRLYFGTNTSRDNIWLSSGISLSSNNRALRGDSEASFGPEVYGSPNSFGNGTWHRVEALGIYNGGTEGTFTTWIDGKIQWSRNDWWENTVYNPDYRSWQIVNMLDRPSTINGTYYDGSYNFDDIYLSYTQARVEIGNNQDFDSCTKREIQIPMSWSTSSISVEINAGTFSEGENAYLFVVDSSGNKSVGYPISFGTSVDPGDTAPPTVDSISPSNGTIALDNTFDIVCTISDNVSISNETFSFITTIDGTPVDESANFTVSGNATASTFTLMAANRTTVVADDDVISYAISIDDSSANTGTDSGTWYASLTEPVTPTDQFAPGALGLITNWTQTNDANWITVVDSLDANNVHASTTGTYPAPFPGSGPQTIMSYDLTVSGSFVFKTRAKIVTQVGSFGDFYFLWGGNGTATGKSQNFVRLDTFDGNTFFGYFDETGARTTTGYASGTTIPATNTWYDIWLEVDSLAVGGTWRIKRDGQILYEGTNVVDATGRITVGTTDDIIGFDGPVLLGVETPPEVDETPVSNNVFTTITRSGGKKATITRGGNKKIIIS